jgi:hypothetical protein
MTIAASPPPRFPGDVVFQRIELYRLGDKVLEAAVDVIAQPNGTLTPTGKVVFTAPMTTTITLESDGKEYVLQIRIPIRGATVYEAWARFDDELKANYGLGIQNELIRRKLVKSEGKG